MASTDQLFNESLTGFVTKSAPKSKPYSETMRITLTLEAAIAAKGFSFVDSLQTFQNYTRQKSILL